ncbi:hypothetical protein HAX54_034505, partial [Datura stramonium]|nr:hypothetical protein [Datura stramonium]
MEMIPTMFVASPPCNRLGPHRAMWFLFLHRAPGLVLLGLHNAICARPTDSDVGTRLGLAHSTGRHAELAAPRAWHHTRVVPNCVASYIGRQVPRTSHGTAGPASRAAGPQG